jgi:leucyl-tRNA synthetase
VVGTSIVDFVAPARKLVVEVDGGYHADSRCQRADARRDKRLTRQGFRLLRLPAQLVLHNMPEALRLVLLALV